MLDNHLADKKIYAQQMFEQFNAETMKNRAC